MSELHLDGQVEAFFAIFAAASDQLDTDRLAELFAETFLAADPAGVQAVPRQAFLHALPRRAELFAAAGNTRVVLTDLQHHALDDTLSPGQNRLARRTRRCLDLGPVVLDLHPAPRRGPAAGRVLPQPPGPDAGPQRGVSWPEPDRSPARGYREPCPGGPTMEAPK